MALYVPDQLLDALALMITRTLVMDIGKGPLNRVRFWTVSRQGGVSFWYFLYSFAFRDRPAFGKVQDGDYPYPLSALWKCRRDQSGQTTQWRAAVSLSKGGVHPHELSARLQRQGTLAGDYTADCRSGGERQRGAGHGAGAGDWDRDGHERTQKKGSALQQVNTPVLEASCAPETTVIIHKGEEAELAERWSFVGSKEEPRWLWQALAHHTGQVLASVFGRHKGEVFLDLKALLAPFGITRSFTDGWGASQRHLEPGQ